MASSLPSTPAAPSNRYKPRSAPSKYIPVTPQQGARRHREQHSLQIAYRSPLSSNSNSSPFTPTSQRSLTTSFSNSSSTLNTPDNTRSGDDIDPKDESFAYIAQNWRERASENGMVPQNYQDDDFSDDEVSDMVSEMYEPGFVKGEAFLSTPFPPNRVRASSLSESPTFASRTFNGYSLPLIVPSSPSTDQGVTSPRVNRNTNQTFQHSIELDSSQIFGTPVRRTLAPLNTPPPNRVLAQQYRAKGSFTDPPQMRRKPPFGPQQQQQLDLFDIDENESYGSHRDEAYDENAAPNAFLMQFQRQVPYVEPYALSYIPGGVTYEQQFHEAKTQYSLMFDAIDHSSIHQRPNPQRLQHFSSQQHQHQLDYLHRDLALHLHENNSEVGNLFPTFGLSTQPSHQRFTVVTPEVCSVCSRSGKSAGMLAVLDPCRHPLCSACLTSALNIVGEKDMECAICKASVKDFKLVDASSPISLIQGVPTKGKEEPVKGSFESFSGPSVGKNKAQALAVSLESLPASGVEASELKIANNDVTEKFDLFEAGAIRASTPKAQRSTIPDDCIVLRIDNVPWDITPFSIESWLRQPVECVHVLLDRKGKTLSHAFIEVKSEDIARAVLRGEANPKLGSDTFGTVGRGSVLGQGRRARGVTITRSGQEELMRAIFPSWRGNFQGSKPTLQGLSAGMVKSAVEGGLMVHSDITALSHLIQAPNSHFLKVPSLPFHSLIGILSKFPSNSDNRGFWCVKLGDALYQVTTAAFAILAREEHENSGLIQAPARLLSSLLHAAIVCPAFTDHQLESLNLLILALNRPQPPTGNNSIASSPPDTLMRSLPAESASFDDLAREFGVEQQLVQALVQRLSASMSM